MNSECEQMRGQLLPEVRRGWVVGGECGAVRCSAHILLPMTITLLLLLLLGPADVAALCSPAVLCPLLCKNGGVCLQSDRCLCPPTFTGKFCQIPVASTVAAATNGASPPSSSTNEVVKPALLSAMTANQELTQSEFLMPLAQHHESVTVAGGQKDFL